MGYGDDLMATGMARGARARGKRIAFGDGKKIIFGPWSEPMFRHNPNIARPGDEGADDLEWIAHYKGHRLYNRAANRRWIWNYGFRAIPGEVFFSEAEQAMAASIEPGFVLIEPNVPRQKSVAANKDWGFRRYKAVAAILKRSGIRVRQFAFGDRRLPVETIRTQSFRDALAVLSRAALYIGPEGGLHHGAAAVGIPAVVMFGGFIPPTVTGYDTHINLTGGASACGSLLRCEHCAEAMRSISVEKVVDSAKKLLNG